MQILRLTAKISTSQFQRSIHSSTLRLKALQNWKRPSIDEIFIPKEPWSRVYARNQKKYNAQFAAGLALFGGTVLVAANTVNTNSTPRFVQSTERNSTGK